MRSDVDQERAGDVPANDGELTMTVSVISYISFDAMIQITAIQLNDHFKSYNTVSTTNY